MWKKKSKRTMVQIGKSIFEGFNLIYEKYAQRASEENLNALLEIYQAIMPNWVKDYNDLSKRLHDKSGINSKEFDDFLDIQLPSDYNVRELKAPKNKQESIFIDIMQRGRIIHLANKIAHQFEYIFENKLRQYMMENEITLYSLEEFYQVKKLMRTIYSQGTREEVRQLARKKLIENYEFDEDFDKGENRKLYQLPELIKAYNDGMYLKALEIENVNSLAHNYDRHDISYGIKREDEDNTLFVMDVYGFGQFSVHIKEPELAAQIKREYTMPIYRKKTAMLVNYMPKKAKEFVRDSKTDDSLDEERNIPIHASSARKQRMRLMEEIKFLNLSKGAKHEMAVKGGLLREELEEIDCAEEER